MPIESDLFWLVSMFMFIVFALFIGGIAYVAIAVSIHNERVRRTGLPGKPKRKRDK